MIFNGIKKGGLVVELNKKDPYKMRILTGNYHNCVIGATRSGKTRCFVLPSIGAIGLSGESMVISDPKGELYDYTRKYLEKLGYKTLAIDFKYPELSQHYNFLQPIINAINEGNIPEAINKTWDMVSALVPNDSHGEKIWTNGEKSILACAILAVVYDNKECPEYQNLTNVYHFIANMCKEVTLKKESYLPLELYIAGKQKNEPHHPALALSGISEIAPSRTRGSFYTSALTTLSLFTNPLIYNMTKKTDIALEDIGNQPVAIFIILPDDKETYYSLASILVDQIYTQLVDQADRGGGQLNNRVNFILDEFGNFTKIPSFNAKMTAGAGRGIRLNLFLQSFAQLEEKYNRETAKIVLGNCENIIYLHSKDKNTLDELSQLLGKYTTTAYNESGNHQGYYGIGRVTQGYSINLMGRELLTSDEIKRIVRPNILLISQHKPAITYCPDISKWIFQDLFGMGDEDYNKALRNKRFLEREQFYISNEIPIWNPLE